MAEKSNVSLAALERRRWQSLVVVLVVMAALAAMIALLSFGQEAYGPFYSRIPAFRAAPLVLVAALSLYLIGQHFELTAFTRCALEARSAVEKLTDRLEHDPLTGLLTRDAFVDEVDVLLAQGRPTGVLFVDLDNFKTVNDRFGHNAGDRLLIEVAKRLGRCAGVGNVGRYAGDEFVVVVDCPAGDNVLHAVADRVLNVLAQPMSFDGEHVSPTAAIGVAMSRPDTLNTSELLREADIAMYLAKERGKAQWARFDPDHARLRAPDIEL
jgi:diguanylate cyclase (GGDEF)-like protein